MNLLKKLMNSTKFWVVTFSFLSLLTFCFSQPATAATSTIFDAIQECAPISNGGFNVNTTGPVPFKTIITSALLTLPPGETGTIKSIVITGPNGQREFGCENLKVQNGTDLIKSCGGNAFLEPGPTNYQASGFSFQPLTDLKFCVNLQ